MIDRALVLARGLGTRLQAADPDVQLDPAQARAADAGLKAMFPIRGRPWLDYNLSALADAGITRVALIVPPDHTAMRRYYEVESVPARLSLTFLVQPEPRGTADAVLAASDWSGGRPFLTLNGDNVYAVPALAALARLDAPGLLVFDSEDLVRSSNIPRERVRAFALVELDREGNLSRIVEKPDSAPHLVSMNCWALDARVFDACRDVPLSARGEYELPEAVALLIARGVRVRGVRASGPVLDLSRRGDAAELERRLAAVVPRP